GCAALVAGAAAGCEGRHASRKPATAPRRPRRLEGATGSAWQSEARAASGSAVPTIEVRDGGGRRRGGGQPCRSTSRSRAARRLPALLSQARLLRLLG